MMTEEQVHSDARIDRSAYPDVDTLRDRHETDHAYLEDLSSLYKDVLETLGDYKSVPKDLKDKVAELVTGVKDDVRDLFTEDGDFRETAMKVSDLLTGLIKGSAEEIVRAKEGGDDLVFFVKRLTQYRNALLEFVTLEDPIDEQLTTVGKAVLIYEAPEGQAYTCKVNARQPMSEVLGDPAFPKVKAVDLPVRRELLNIAHAIYLGAPGILGRKNVFLVTAPENAGLKPRQILGKASSMYCARYEEADREQAPPANDEKDES